MTGVCIYVSQETGAELNMKSSGVQENHTKRHKNNKNIKENENFKCLIKNGK
jgi:hypothetical protein